MALAQGTVGPQLNSDGAVPAGGMRMGRLGGQMVSELHARYFEQSFRKNMFLSATQAGQTTTVGLATTYVGLVLSNPIGSPVNLVPNKVSFAWAVIAAAVDSVGIAVGYNGTTNVTHTTPVAPRSAFLGAPVGNGLTDTSATLPTAPTYAMFFPNGNTPAATTNPGGGQMDLEGAIVIPPGGYLCTVTTAASAAAAFFASIMWEEIPV